MSFQEFYGLGGKLRRSELAQIPEVLYRSPDVDRAKTGVRPGQAGPHTGHGTTRRR
ncbi:hypothetical protein [Amycolatopsis methanolica]|uniref:hypothetical protein n=1 Tax=Amycolatopsis methanolica TaxID=1814 RepID=UPI00037C4ABB|nr:hypothetical protein [Amycolatopsis methanolica]